MAMRSGMSGQVAGSSSQATGTTSNSVGVALAQGW